MVNYKITNVNSQHPFKISSDYFRHYRTKLNFKLNISHKIFTYSTIYVMWAEFVTVQHVNSKTENKSIFCC